jgi:hypothetical protein
MGRSIAEKTGQYGVTGPNDGLISPALPGAEAAPEGLQGRMPISQGADPGMVRPLGRRQTEQLDARQGAA